MREMIKMVVVLTVLSTVSGGLLAAVKSGTQERIENQVLNFVKGPAIRSIMEGATNDPINDRFNLAVGELHDAGKISDPVALWLAMADESSTPPEKIAKEGQDARQQADALLASWTPQQRQAKLEASMAEVFDEIPLSAMLVASFSLFDLLWIFLALGTAYKLGAGGMGDD